MILGTFVVYLDATPKLKTKPKTNPLSGYNYLNIILGYLPLSLDATPKLKTKPKINPLPATPSQLLHIYIYKL